MQPWSLRLAVVFATSLLVGSRAVADAPPGPVGRAMARLAPELDAIPRDSMCIISTRIPALREHKPTRRLLDRMASDPSFKPFLDIGAWIGAAGYADFDRTMGNDIGIDGSSVERISVVLGRLELGNVQNQKEHPPFARVFTVRKPYDRARILKTVIPDATEEKQGKRTYYFDKAKGRGVCFLDDRSFAVGTETYIKELLVPTEKKSVNAVMDGVLELAAESAFVIGINPESLGPLAGAVALAAAPPEPWATLLRGFVDLKCFILCLDPGEEFQIDLLLECATERDQKALAEALRKNIELSRQKLTPLLTDPSLPNPLEAFLPLLKGTEAALKATAVREEGLHLHVPLFVRADTSKPAAKPARLAERRLEEIWSDLARPGVVGMRASHRDVRTLASAPEQAWKILKERLKPSPALDPAERTTIENYLQDLDSEDFGKRERATLALIKLGSKARPTLQTCLAGELGSLEVRRRLERIMEKMRADLLSPEERRGLRALEVLERIGSPEARGLIRTIAEGEPGAPLTRDARKRLTRLK